MKQIRVEDAVGQVLCHDLTRIVKDEMKGVQFKKGHVIREEDIPMLLDMGKRNIYVWELREGSLHENDAAVRLVRLCQNAHMARTAVQEGKIELTAEIDGLFRIDTQRLRAINALDEIMIACRHSLSPVRAGDKLAGMRVIPLVIEEETIRAAERAAGTEPVLELLPYRLKTACVITTGSEVMTGRIKDTFTPVVIEKLAAYGVEVIHHVLVGDDHPALMGAIQAARALSPDMILCTGGMSVDPDDNTPAAIRKSGARIITYGASVLPGAMFLLGYFENGTPIMGLPGCVMYARATIFDIVLPRIVAGIPLQKSDFADMGNGGLCLGCKPCHYPVCPFGRLL